MTPDKDFERSEARGAELREELAATDARRAEEDTAKAEDDVAAAEKRRADAEAKERQLKAEAEQAHKTAERERAEADQAAAASNVSGGRVASPGIGSSTDPNAGAAASRDSTTASYAAGGAAAQTGADRPEVLVGAAFAGAFVFAQILKRLVD